MRVDNHVNATYQSAKVLGLLDQETDPPRPTSLKLPSCILEQSRKNPHQHEVLVAYLAAMALGERVEVTYEYDGTYTISVVPLFSGQPGEP